MSFVKTETALVNLTEKTPAGDPQRAGYAFGGWKIFDEETQTETIIGSAMLATVPDGTALTAIWNEIGN